ncbi:hypothetical protein ACFPRL_11685 [Pseudoclavibacter helvolus]
MEGAATASTPGASHTTEERENLVCFGARYRDSRRVTKRPSLRNLGAWPM